MLPAPYNPWRGLHTQCPKGTPRPTSSLSQAYPNGYAVRTHTALWGGWAVGGFYAADTK